MSLTSKILRPGGHKIPLPTSGVVAVVYPIGWDQVEEFLQTVGGVLRSLSETDIAATLGKAREAFLAANAAKEGPDGETGAAAEAGASVMAVLVDLGPMAIAATSRLARSCTRYEMANGTPLESDHEPFIPHWEAAQIIEAWFLESFGKEGTLDPWIALLKRMMTRLTEGQQRRARERQTGSGSGSDPETAGSGSPTT